jgi:hypothetical protein
VTRWVTALVAVALCLAGCSSGGQTPTAKVPSLPKGETWTLSQVAGYLRAGCPNRSGRIHLDIAQGDTHLRHTFICDQVDHDETGTEAELAGLSSTRHDAAQRADRVIAIEKALRLTQQLRSSLIWNFGTGVDSLSCTRAGDSAYHRRELESAADYSSVGPNGSVTPEHQSAPEWAKIEVGYIAGACPQQLGAFFTSLAQAGHPKAATAVRGELRALRIPT